MNAPSNEADLGGGVKIVAAVALAGILAIVAFVFASGEEKDERAAEVSALSDSTKGGPGSSVPNPTPDKATSERGGGLNAADRSFAPPTIPMPVPVADPAAQAELEAALAARAIDSDHPPEFDNPNEAREWWTAQQKRAAALNERRRAAVEDLPRQEALVNQAANPEKSRALFEKRKARQQAALAESNDELARIAAELARL